jgi:hypothetical protein
MLTQDIGMDKRFILETLIHHERELSAAGILHVRVFGSVARDEASTASVNCLELPADGHFAWDVRWQGLKPDVFSIVYGPTKVVP